MAYFFVGGARRGGTTLLQGLLCSGPATNPLIYECFLLQHIVEAYRNGRYKFDEFGPPHFADLEAFQSFYRRVVGDFLEQTRSLYAPAEHLVLKETNISRYFHDIFDLVPDARYVVVARDPRDVVASLIEVGEKLPKQNQNAWYAGRDMKRLADYYKGFYRTPLVAPDPAFRRNLLFVRYEDLVRDPSSQIERLSQFTGFPIPTSAGQTPWQRNQWKFDEMSRWQIEGWRSELWGKDVSDSNIGKYKMKLTAEELAALDGELAEVYRLFGYTASGELAPSPLFAAAGTPPPRAQI